MAQTWTPAATAFPGSMRAGSREAPVTPGETTAITMQRLPAGASVTVLHGAELLTPEPLVVGEDGTLSVPVQVPADAETGLHPLTVVTQNPASVSQVMLKLSKVVPPQNAEGFAMTSAPVGERAYQSAVSADGKLFVTSARGPNDGSRLLRLDATTLAVEAEAELPTSAEGEQVGVFGVAVDNAHGKVWTTNTLAGTVTVYDAADLTVAKVFPEGSVQHPRDVVIDEANNRAYVSTSFTPEIIVFDTRTLEPLEPITVQSNIRGEDFGTMALDLDAEAGKLVTASLNTPEAAIVDLKTGEAKVIEAKGAQGASGAAYDAQDGLIFVASQKTDNLLIISEETGEVLHDVEVGAGPLNVTFEPVSRHAFVANRGSGTITVVDTEGKIVANLDAGSFPNQLRADGKGNVYAVNKSRGENDEAGDRVWRIHPAE